MINVSSSSFLILKWNIKYNESRRVTFTLYLPVVMRIYDEHFMYTQAINSNLVWYYTPLNMGFQVFMVKIQIVVFYVVTPYRLLGGSSFQNAGLQNCTPWQLRRPEFKLWTYFNIFRRVQQHISDQCDKYWLSSPVRQKFACSTFLNKINCLSVRPSKLLLFLWISLFPSM